MRGRGRGVLGDQMSVGGSERAAVQPDCPVSAQDGWVRGGEDMRKGTQGVASHKVMDSEPLEWFSLRSRLQCLFHDLQS